MYAWPDNLLAFLRNTATEAALQHAYVRRSINVGYGTLTSFNLSENSREQASATVEEATKEKNKREEGEDGAVGTRVTMSMAVRSLCKEEELQKGRGRMARTRCPLQSKATPMHRQRWLRLRLRYPNHTLRRAFELRECVDDCFGAGSKRSPLPSGMARARHRALKVPTT